MYVSMDRKGNMVQFGEGSFRVPVSVEESDNSLSNPVSAAEAMLERDRVQYATLAKKLAKIQAKQQQKQIVQQQEADELQDYQDFVREAALAVNDGEHPLAYIAALQCAAGNSMDQYSPLNGYMLSDDGSMKAAHRTTSGHSPLRGNMGDLLSDLQDISSQVQEAVDQGQDLYSSVQSLVPQGGGSVSVPQAVVVEMKPQTAPPKSDVPQAKKGLMDMKLLGVPVALLALAGGALYLMNRK